MSRSCLAVRRACSATMLAPRHLPRPPSKPATRACTLSAIAGSRNPGCRRLPKLCVYTTHGNRGPPAQPNPLLRVLSNSASTETHAPASAQSLSSCASRPPTPSQDSESQQMPMAAMKSEMSQTESQPSATQRLERDQLEMIQEFQRKHDIVLSRVQLEAVANLLRGVDVLSIWATGTGKKPGVPACGPYTTRVGGGSYAT